MRTNRSASATGSGFSSTEWTIAKTTVFTLRQAASVISAVSVKPRSLDRTRTPKRMSRSSESMMFLRHEIRWLAAVRLQKANCVPEDLTMKRLVNESDAAERAPLLMKRRSITNAIIPKSDSRQSPALHSRALRQYAVSRQYCIPSCAKTRSSPNHSMTGVVEATGRCSSPGHDVVRNTIKAILRDHGIEPAPDRGAKTPWRTFLAAQWDALAAADFFTVEALTLRGVVRYVVFFVIKLKSRRVAIAGIVQQPDETWMMQDASVGFSHRPRTTFSACTGQSLPIESNVSQCAHEDDLHP